MSNSLPLYLSDLNDKRRKYIESEIKKGFYGHKIYMALKDNKKIIIGSIQYLKRPKTE
jgi:hypothetical protein